jgi:hypothetical protein
MFLMKSLVYVGSVENAACEKAFVDEAAAPVRNADKEEALRDPKARTAD